MCHASFSLCAVSVLLVASLTVVSSRADTVPPSVPTNVRLLQLGPNPTRVAITWNASTDSGGSGLKEYIIYRNGRVIQRNVNNTGVDDYLLPATEYRFSVAAMDNASNISARSEDVLVTSLAVPTLAPALKVETVLLKFADFPAPLFDTNYVNDMVYLSTNSVDAYFQEASYGQTELAGQTHGWYDLPSPGSNYCTFTLNGGLWYGCDTAKILQDALAVIPPSANLANADAALLVINGMGIVGLSGGKYKYFAATWLSPDTIIHEIGHNIPGTSVKHAAGLDSCASYPMPPNIEQPGSGGCLLGRYTDDYDAMGAGNSYHFSAYAKLLLGMIHTSQIFAVTNDGSYQLDQYELPSGGAKALRIPLGDEYAYMLEYRRPVGFDGPGTPEKIAAPVDGVLIRLRVSAYPGTDAETVRPNVIINPGNPFIDPYRGLRIDVVSKDSTGAVIQVEGIGRPFELTDVHPQATDTRDVVHFNTVRGARYRVDGGATPFVYDNLITGMVAPAMTTSWTNSTPTVSNYYYRVRVAP
jgi:hypothetical protein